MKSLTSKPGTFRAFCKQSEWRPLTDYTPEQQADENLQSRWDRKLRAEVVAVTCDETFDDAADFERHMLEQHGRKPSAWAPSKGHHETWTRSIDAGWPKMRLPAEGKPWKHKPGVTSACRGCGLVVELGAGSTAFIEEHKATCELRQAAS